MNEVLECIMLVCFGFSWPLNAIKHLKAGTATSMSLPFIVLILVGYVAGITAKLIVPPEHFYVLLFYCINFSSVFVDLMIYFINRRKDKMRASNSL